MIRFVNAKHLQQAKRLLKYAASPSTGARRRGLAGRLAAHSPGEVMDGWVAGGLRGLEGGGEDGIVFNNKICMQARIPG